jgi:hypothetical protein
MSDQKAIQKQLSENKTAAFEIDFGTRKVSRLKTSRIVAIPKQALANFLSEPVGKPIRTNGVNPISDIEISQVNVTLVQQVNGDRFIKLSPIHDANPTVLEVRTGVRRKK